MPIPSIRQWLLVCLALWVIPSSMACTEKEKDLPRAAVASSPAPLTITPSSTGIWYRYIDPSTGAVSTATTIDEVPQGARAQVVVYQEAHPTPPGWEQVADLSKTLPVTTTPRRGFSLQTRRGDPASTARKQRGEIVLFSTSWCGYCRKARDFFKAERVPFSEFDMEKDPKARPRMAALAKSAGVSPASLKGVPIIFVGDQAMSGFDKPRLKKLLGR